MCFVVKQKTAYEMLISDWSSDVCSADLLTGYRRQEGQAMHRSWLHSDRGYVMFPDTKGGAQIRAIGPAAIRVLEAQAEIAGNPHLFPSAVGDGPFTAVSECLKRVCGLAGIKGVTPHTLRHTFGSVSGDLGLSELTIRSEEHTYELQSLIRTSYD